MLAMKNSLLSVMEIFIKRLASHQVNKGFDQRKKNYRVKSENILSQYRIAFAIKKSIENIFYRNICSNKNTWKYCIENSDMRSNPNLCVQAVRQGHNPSTYSKFAILRSRDEWRQNPPGPLPPNIKVCLFYGVKLSSVDYCIVQVNQTRTRLFIGIVSYAFGTVSSGQTRGLADQQGFGVTDPQGPGIAGFFL